MAFNDDDDERNDDDLTVTDAELAALVEEGETLKESEAQVAGRIFRSNLGLAAATVCKLARQASSEKLRLEASKIIMDRAMGRVQDATQRPSDDPLVAMFEELLSAKSE